MGASLGGSKISRWRENTTEQDVNIVSAKAKYDGPGGSLRGSKNRPTCTTTSGAFEEENCKFENGNIDNYFAVLLLSSLLPYFA